MGGGEEAVKQKVSVRHLTTVFLSHRTWLLIYLVPWAPQVCLFVFLISYLFIWLHWVLVAAGGLLSCGSRAPQLWHANS